MTIVGIAWLVHVDAGDPDDVDGADATGPGRDGTEPRWETVGRHAFADPRDLDSVTGLAVADGTGIGDARRGPGGMVGAGRLAVGRRTQLAANPRDRIAGGGGQFDGESSTMVDAPDPGGLLAIGSVTAASDPPERGVVRLHPAGAS